LIAKGFDAEECLKAMGAIETDLKQLTSVLTDAQFHQAPRTGGWSIGDCVEHLVLTGQEFLPKWDAALDEASRLPQQKRLSSRYRWWQRYLLGAIEPPYKLKAKTRQNFVPHSRLPKDDTVERFMSMHQEFVRRIERARGLDVDRIKVQSPFAGWLRYPLGFSFDFALAHERRHLWQARQVYRSFQNSSASERRT
jgi:hypothetical protein